MSFALSNALTPSLELLSHAVLILWEVLSGLIAIFLYDSLVEANVDGSVLTGNDVFGTGESGTEANTECSRGAVCKLDGSVNGIDRRKMRL